MRITNSIMLNTSKNNINGNKITMDIMNTQMATQKKISKPSDDPIIAVRALRLRASVTELTQYAEKNIDDALSWMEVTEASMTNMRDIVKDMYSKFVQGDNDYLGTSERLALVEQLEKLSEMFYDEGNSSYAGRTIFSGYKTGTDCVFKDANPDAVYEINETFTVSQLGTRDYISNNVTVDKGNLNNVIQNADFPETSEITTFNLTYSGMTQIDSLTYTDAAGNQQTIPVTSYRITSGNDNAYLSPAPNGVNYIVETGELVFGMQVEQLFSTLPSDTVVTATYTKEGFDKGDINPVMYFTCTDNTDPANPIEYVREKQDIEYNVGFNQSVKVNTEASDVLLLDIRKEIANLRDAVTAVDECEKKKADIETMLEDSRYTTAQKEVLQSMLSATEKELDLKKARMVGMFKQGVGNAQEYQAHVDLQVSDIGNRYSRLQMIKTRAEQQQENFEGLMTQNEDRELSDILLDYTAANYSYQLSLQATGSISKLSLLNYI